mmetsp:Transcript_68312/g.172812  ORF Transcript_68312/g.172812 Transcript_68312/m.172812 type:complete len:224 (+) Transcript_68312:105-776(+)
MEADVLAIGLEVTTPRLYQRLLVACGVVEILGRCLDLTTEVSEIRNLHFAAQIETSLEAALQQLDLHPRCCTGVLAIREPDAEPGNLQIEIRRDLLPDLFNRDFVDAEHGVAPEVDSFRLWVQLPTLETAVERRSDVASPKALGRLVVLQGADPSELQYLGRHAIQDDRVVEVGHSLEGFQDIETRWHRLGVLRQLKAKVSPCVCMCGHRTEKVRQLLQRDAR